MSDWKHGYFAESGYTYGFYTETTPARLAWVATLKGLRAPLEKFRYIDLGCGQGLNLIQMAAIHPESEFVGIDFMPEHIAHGRYLAAQAGLTNVSFVEGDFIELAKQPQTLGEFDYAVAHGITTWISPEVREGLFSLAGQILKPGGLMYNSYNTYPGWLSAAPFQNLVSQLQTRYSGKQALEIAQASMASLKKAGSGLFKALPGLQSRLEGMKKQDPAYLAQEYNNAYWQPVYSSQMLRIARGHKLEFMASATLPEVFDGCYPKPILDLINSETDAILKETIRDLGLAQSFRRDIYIKGAFQHWSVDRLAVLGQQRFVATDLVALPSPDKGFEFKGGMVNVTGKTEAYTQVIDAFGQGGKTFTDALKQTGSQGIGAFAQTVSLLLQGGWLALEGSEQSKSAKKLNQVMAKACVAGAPYRYLCCPRMLSATPINELDFLLIALMNESVKPDELGQRLVGQMKVLNRRIAQDGKPMEDPKAQVAKADEIAQQFLKVRLKNYQRLGAI